MGSRHYQKVADFDIDKFSFDKRRVPTSSKMHFHKYIEIEFVLSGKGTHVFNEYVLPICPGSAYILINSDYHQVLVEEELTLYNLSLSEELLSGELLGRLYHLNSIDRITKIGSTDAEDLKLLFQLLERNAARPTGEDSTRYTLRLTEGIIYYILKNANMTEPSGQALQPITEAMIYVHRHFAENPRLSDAAKAVNLSPSYLSRLFRKQYGLSYVEYLSRLRLERARYLLLHDTMSITDVCYACGFNSLSNFNKYFKQYHQISPAQFRREHREKGPLE